MPIAWAMRDCTGSASLGFTSIFCSHWSSAINHILSTAITLYSTYALLTWGVAVHHLYISNFDLCAGRMYMIHLSYHLCDLLSV